WRGGASAAPRFNRGALSIFVTAVSSHIGHSTRPRVNWPWNSSSDANQPSKLWLFEHWRLRTFMAIVLLRLSLPVQYPRARRDVLKPQCANERLGVCHAAVAAP